VKQGGAMPKPLSSLNKMEDKGKQEKIERVQARLSFPTVLAYMLYSCLSAFHLRFFGGWM
jgi:hypothetical protein